MSHVHEGPLATYNSLLDPHLSGYYSNSSIRRHLRKSKLVNKRGEVISESKYRLLNAKAEHRKQVREMLAKAIVTKTIDIERMRQAKIKRRLEDISKIELVKRVRAERRFGYEEAIMDLLRPVSSRRSDENRSKSALPRITSARSTGSSSYKRNTRSMRSRTPRDAYSSGSAHSAGRSAHSRETRSHSESRRSRHSSPDSESSFSSRLSDESQREGRHTSPRSRSSSARISNRDSSAPPVEWRPKPPAPRSGKDTPRDEHGRPLQTKKRVRGRVILHRQEPAFKHEKDVQTFCEVTLTYLGRSGEANKEGLKEILVEQQHCGGNTLTMFKEYLKPNTKFTFISRRHRGFPFGLTFYIDGQQDATISTCCEYRHKPGSLLGSHTSHFRFNGVQGAESCYKCKVEEELNQKQKNKKEQKEKNDKKEREAKQKKEQKVIKEEEDDGEADEVLYQGEAFEADDAEESWRSGKEDRYDSDFENEGAAGSASDRHSEEEETAREIRSYADELEPKPASSSKSSSCKAQTVVVHESDDETEPPTARVDRDADTVSIESDRSDRSRTSVKSASSVSSKKSTTSIHSARSAHSEKSAHSERSAHSVKSERSLNSERSARSYTSNSNAESASSSNTPNASRSSTPTPSTPGPPVAVAAVSAHPDQPLEVVAERRETAAEESTSETAMETSSEPENVLYSADSLKCDYADNKFTVNNSNQLSVKELCKVLEKSNRIKELTLTGCSKYTMGELSSSLLKSDCKLQSLVVSGNDFGLSGTLSLCAVIKSKPTIQTFEASNCDMTDVGAAELVRCFKEQKNSALRTLRLENCKLENGETYKSIAELLKLSQVENVILSGNPLSESGAKGLSKLTCSLKDRKISRVHLSDMKLGPAIAENSNLPWFHEAKIGNLNLFNNALTDSSMASILANAREITGQAVEKVDLETGNMMSDDGREKLEKWMKGERITSESESESETSSSEYSDESAKSTPRANDPDERAENSQTQVKASVKADVEIPVMTKPPLPPATTTKKSNETSDPAKKSPDEPASSSSFDSGSDSETDTSDSETDRETRPPVLSAEAREAKPLISVTEEYFTAENLPTEEVYAQLRPLTAYQQLRPLTSSKPKSIHLTNCDLSDTTGSKLLRDLSKLCHNAREISIEKCTFSSLTSSTMATILDKSQQLTSFCLKDCVLTDNQLVTILQPLSNKSRLYFDSFIAQQAKQVVGESMKEAVRSPSLASIVTTDSDQQSVDVPLPNPVLLESLHLTNSGAGNGTLEEILKILTSRKLKHLNLSSNKDVTGFGWKDLLLKTKRLMNTSSCSLQTLDISSNQLPKYALEQIPGLRLDTLNMTNCGLTDAHLEMLIGMMSTQKTDVTNLVLDKNSAVSSQVNARARYAATGQQSEN